ncbi:MAG: hypothetical protein ABII00_12470 [Elusimicrobiota bacterium]
MTTIQDLLTLRNLVMFTGLLHFCQVPALFFAPRMLDWEKDFSKLRLINRRIFQVIGGAIVLTVLGLGVVVVVASDEIVQGGRLGLSLVCFLGLFWAYRCAIQVLLYARIWPEGWLARLSHYGLTALFTFLSGSYLVVFVLILLRTTVAE